MSATISSAVTTAAAPSLFSPEEAAETRRRAKSTQKFFLSLAQRLAARNIYAQTGVGVDFGPLEQNSRRAIRAVESGIRKGALDEPTGTRLLLEFLFPKLLEVWRAALPLVSASLYLALPYDVPTPVDLEGCLAGLAGKVVCRKLGADAYAVAFTTDALPLEVRGSRVSFLVGSPETDFVQVQYSVDPVRVRLPWSSLEDRDAMTVVCNPDSNAELPALEIQNSCSDMNMLGSQAPVPTSTIPSYYLRTTARKVYAYVEFPAAETRALLDEIASVGELADAAQAERVSGESAAQVPLAEVAGDVRAVKSAEWLLADFPFLGLLPEQFWDRAVLAGPPALHYAKTETLPETTPFPLEFYLTGDPAEKESHWADIVDDLGSALSEWFGSTDCDAAVNEVALSEEGTWLRAETPCRKIPPPIRRNPPLAGWDSGSDSETDTESEYASPLVFIGGIRGPVTSLKSIEQSKRARLVIYHGKKPPPGTVFTGREFLLSAAGAEAVSGGIVYQDTGKCGTSLVGGPEVYASGLRERTCRWNLETGVAAGTLAACGVGESFAEAVQLARLPEARLRDWARLGSRVPGIDFGVVRQTLRWEELRAAAPILAREKDQSVIKLAGPPPPGVSYRSIGAALDGDPAELLAELESAEADFRGTVAKAVARGLEPGWPFLD